MSLFNERYESGLWKFVVIGSYDADNAIHHKELRIFEPNLTHKSQVKEGERATSAGTVGLFDAYWKMYQGYSTTLNLGYDNFVILAYKLTTYRDKSEACCSLYLDSGILVDGKTWAQAFDVLDRVLNPRPDPVNPEEAPTEELGG